MNLNQAKKIKGQDALREAIKQCTKLAAQHHPDRNPNDKAAAKRFVDLMRVRDSLKKRLPHGCAVCGEPIGRTATHCRTHQRRKLLPTGTHEAKPVEPKRNAKDRVSVVGDPLALHGYYTAPVQKIVSKWRDEIGETKLQSYFESVASPVVFRECEIQLPLVAPQHWQAVFELGQAICAVMNNTKQPHAWLLRTPGIHVATNGRFPSVAEIGQKIIDAGGPDFTRGNIAQALKGLRLATSDEIADDWRKSVMKKTG